SVGELLLEGGGPAALKRGYFTPRNKRRPVMSGDASFHGLTARVRAGDQGAAKELVEEYGPPTRREVRVRLFHARLAHVFESMDVMQSLWGSFFQGAREGEYHQLENPTQLLKLFKRMVRNKVIDLVRHELREKRH